MAQQRVVEDLPRLVTDTLGASRDIALARIWLVEPGDECAACKDASICLNQSKCLHLMASSGRSIINDFSFTTINGAFRRFPLGVRKVGLIAATGKPAEVLDVKEDASWVADPQWVRREKIRSFGGQPLIYHEEILGVLSIFTRVQLEEGTLGMLRMVADHLAYAIANARAFEEIQKLKRQIEIENAYLREEVNIAQSFKGLIGESEAMKRVRKLIEQVGPTNAHVLVTGESGTGKEMVAREIHNYSSRRDRPMIKINCPSIPKDLFESEFFGHTRGAFTGAIKSRMGYFQAADGGTLFLDEVGEIPIGLQSKLLRVLQDGEYQRVGEDSMRKADVRIVSATNRNLQSEIKTGRFREDLYYRLQVFPFEIQPLRERREDIPLLAEHFLKLCAQKLNRPPIRLTQTHIEALSRYVWPGNVRELQNIIERAVITSQFDKLHIELPAVLHAGQGGHESSRTRSKTSQVRRILTEDEMRRLERDNLLEALRLCNWKIYGEGGASEALGVKPTTLVSRMKKMGIARRE